MHCHPEEPGRDSAGAPLRPLRPCGRLVLLDDVGRDTAAVLDRDALPLGPLADPGGVDGAAVAPAAGRAPGRAAGPPGVREVLPQCLAQLVAVRGAEVDLVFRAVQAEADGAGRLAAVEVINEQRLNSLSHEKIIIPSGEGKRPAALAVAARTKIPTKLRPRLFRLRNWQ